METVEVLCCVCVVCDTLPALHMLKPHMIYHFLKKSQLFCCHDVFFVASFNSFLHIWSFARLVFPHLGRVNVDIYSLAFQLFSVAAPGGCSGVEDQTDLLGIAAKRSKSTTHKHQHHKTESRLRHCTLKMLGQTEGQPSAQLPNQEVRNRIRKEKINCTPNGKLRTFGERPRNHILIFSSGVKGWD